MGKIERVHVLFKTHLDIGFTDLADAVIDKYMRSYIPQAIALAEQLAAEGGQARFVWTTGSWLVHEYLQRADEAERRKMEAAIAQGHIVWHGLPFTTHTELLDPGLFAYGLSLAERLDRRFGKRTRAAKMTDVPGHTRAIVSPMAAKGIRYLHLGVNPASKVPEVPPLFVWRGGDGAEMIVNYADNYGNTLEIDGLNEAMVFAHTGDNCGPPSAEEIRGQFALLARQFPGADIRASTMDAFVEALLPLKHRLPVVEEEIGDSWIHGAASDPLKIGQYRALLRLRARWLAEGRLDPGSREHGDFSDNLLLVAEHTWGMDEKKFLTDFKHYAKNDFVAARHRDVVAADAVPDKYKYIGAFAMDELDWHAPGLFGSASANGKPEKSFARFERSWAEQRGYVLRAVQALEPAKRLEAEIALRELKPRKSPDADGRRLQPGATYTFGDFQVAFAADGSIAGLQDRRGKQWADERRRIGVILYESFGVENYNEWFERYVENIDRTHAWADADFGKPGMENVRPRPVHRRFEPFLESLVATETADGAVAVLARLSMPSTAVNDFGAPGAWEIEYRFGGSAAPGRIGITLQWFGKQANRLPEATWFSISPLVNNPNLWKLDKLGERVSPLEVVRSGNRNLHAVHTGIHYRGADGSVAIETLDAPVAAPGERKILRFDNRFASLDGGFHFLLHNNVWGTNFPMWYEDDGKFRFALTVRSER